MKYILWSFCVLIFAAQLVAQPVQFRGPARDGHFPEQGLLKSWPEEGPSLILETENLGKGWSTPVLTGDKIYVTGMIDTLDYLSALDMNGNILWQTSYGRSWNQSFPDTRSTPVVDGDRIYVQSGTGRVACIEKETGKELWAVGVDQKFAGEYHLWGNSETPLVVDDKVICSPGGSETSVVALDKMTGETIWKTKSLGGPRAYASATLYEYNGFRYILAVIGTHLMAIRPDSGEIAWSYQYHNPEKWDQPGLIWTNTPVYRGDEIFISKGYDYYSVMLKMDPSGTSVSEKFIDNTLDNHHHGMILSGDYLYGSNWQDNRRGKWVCMDWNTGEIKYEEEWDTKGAVVMADGMLYAYNERGSVGLIKPDPEKFEIVSQFKVTKGAGPHWAHPYITDGKLLIRHGEALLVYDIREK